MYGYWEHCVYTVPIVPAQIPTSGFCLVLHSKLNTTNLLTAFKNIYCSTSSPGGHPACNLPPSLLDHLSNPRAFLLSPLFVIPSFHFKKKELCNGPWRLTLSIPSFAFWNQNLQLIRLLSKDRPSPRRNAAKHLCKARRKDPYEKHVFLQKPMERGLSRESEGDAAHGGAPRGGLGLVRTSEHGKPSSGWFHMAQARGEINRGKWMWLRRPNRTIGFQSSRSTTHWRGKTRESSYPKWLFWVVVKVSAELMLNQSTWNPPNVPVRGVWGWPKYRRRG